MQGTKFAHAITILLLLAAISSNSLASVAFVDTKRILAEAPEARRGESQAKVVEKANEVIRKFAEGKNIHFVFQEVVYASPRVNITNQILEAMNGRGIGDLNPIFSEPRMGFVHTERILSEASATWGLNPNDPSLVARANDVIRQVARSENLDLIFQESVYASLHASITDRVVSKISGSSSNQEAVGISFDLTRVRFIRTERVLRESPQAVAAQKLLEAEFKGRELDLRANTRSSGRQDEAAVERFKADLNRRRNDELSKVISVSNSAIRHVAERQQIDLVFQKAVYASPLVDMTDLALTELAKGAISPQGGDGKEIVGIPGGDTGETLQTLNPQNRLALLIGNASYQTSPLVNPVNDVRGMATALRKAGFTVIKHENLNFRQMREAVRDFGEKLSKDHVGFFYYSGHGVQVDGKNYLIPVNSDIKYEDEVATSALDADMVLAKLESAKNKLNIVVLDACRDSPLGRRTRTSTKGLSNMNAASGTMIAFSTAPGQVALDGKGSNSPYTKHLISAIQKEGLLLEQVFKEVRGNVMKDTNGTQVPWENSSILGDFYFVPRKDIK